MTRFRASRPAALVPAVLLATAMLATGMVTTTEPATAEPPPGQCQTAEPGGPAVTELPWAQQWLAPERAWPLGTGRGVTVAVIDSGVDAEHPQLRKPGVVLPGRDLLLPGDERANFDCVSHGTAVASIIAAQPSEGIGFHGVAPDARILPIRVSERDASEQEGAAVNADVFADAIRYAADSGATVINISLSMYADLEPVRDAIQYARSRDVLIVAAAGNAHTDNGPDPVTYPAAYPGVLGVAATTIEGTRLDSSQEGPYVDIAAPGGGVLAATREHGHRYHDGTSFAAGFVSGTAALVRSADPELPAEEVANRLLATATPAPGPSDQYGEGVVNPSRAMRDVLGTSEAKELPDARPTPVDVAAEHRAAAWHDAGTLANRMAVGAGVLVILLLTVAVVLPAGRRRGWRAG